MTLTWATKRVAEHLSAVGTDITNFLDAQAHPASASNGCEALFLSAARGIAAAGEDI